MSHKTPIETLRSTSIRCWGRPPPVEGRLSRWERTHLLQHFAGSVTERAPEVEPVSVAAFRGRFDHNELSLAPRLLLRIARVASRAISERIPDGDFRNWEAIGEWTASLVPVLVNGGERGDSGR